MQLPAARRSAHWHLITWCRVLIKIVRPAPTGVLTINCFRHYLQRKLTRRFNAETSSVQLTTKHIYFQHLHFFYLTTFVNILVKLLRILDFFPCLSVTTSESDSWSQFSLLHFSWSHWWTVMCTLQLSWIKPRSCAVANCATTLRSTSCLIDLAKTVNVTHNQRLLAC